MASAAFARVLDHLAAQSARLAAHRDADPLTLLALSREMAGEYARVGGEAPPLAADTRIQGVTAAGVPAEWVCAAGADPSCRVLFVHGGAWISGEAQHYRHLNEHLSRAAAASVLAIDYRLAPEHPFPAALQDCLAAWAWMLENGPEGAPPVASGFMAGDSAGGNIVLACVLQLKAQDLPLPDAVATLGAATDLTAASPSVGSRAEADPVLTPDLLRTVPQVYVQGRAPLEDPLVSPLFGDLADLPPLVMHVGDREVLLDDTLRFAEKAKAAGSAVAAKVWPEMVHVFELFCHMLPEARQSLDEVAAFLKRHKPSA